MAQMPLKRHPALQDLSRDHHHALIHAQQLRKSAGLDSGARPLPEVVREFLVFWDQDASQHFREEEEVLLPIYARHVRPSQDEQVLQMLDDHAWFRDQIYTLRAQWEAGADLQALAGEMGRRLHDHVRLEERHLFERIQATLTEQDLNDLAERSHAFREAWRLPGCIGPVRT